MSLSRGHFRLVARRIVTTPSSVRAAQNRDQADRAGYAERRLRPLVRRLVMTLRPPTVSIRERKPWRRLRTSFEG